MENSISDNEAHVRSPPRRRRSTFFIRRDSFAPQPSENIDPNVNVNSAESNEKQKEDLERYYNKLMTEKDQWKKEVNNRRNKYHEIKQQYVIAAKAPSRSWICYSALSNEDIEFIKGKPNISKLVDSQLKLQKSVKETVAIVRRTNELDDVILRYSEDKVNKITEYILENSMLQ